MTKQSDIDALNKSIREQEQTIRIFERDLIDGSRVNQLIATKESHIAKLQAEIQTLKTQQDRLPTVLANAKHRLEVLKRKKLAVATSSEVDKLQKLIAKAQAQGIDVASLIGPSNGG